MAHLKTKATTEKPTEREQWKWNLVRELFDRGYDRNEIRQLFRLIDRMMTFPEELQRGFEDRLVPYQEERQMPLLSWIEIRAMERVARESVIEVLEVRFNDIPIELREKLNTISDVAVLKQLHRKAIAINSLLDFQQVLDETNS